MAERKLLVQCPQCPNKIELFVAEKNFGTEMEVTCGGCEKRFKAKIPIPPPPIREPTAKEIARKIIGFAQGKQPPPHVQPLIAQFAQAVGRVINRALEEDNREIENIVKQIRAAGWNPFVELTATFGAMHHSGDEHQETTEELREPTPLVVQGDVVAGTFNGEDQNWLRDFKITLD